MLKLLNRHIVGALLFVPAASAIGDTASTANTNSSWFARVWQSDDGLPDNNVSGVMQTPDGYLWVSTHSSLSKFDGVRFRRVLVPAPPGRSQLIRAFVADRTEAWIAMEGGILAHLAEGRTNVLTTADGLSSFRPLVIAKDADGSTWIGYADGSACRITAGRVTRYTARDGLTGAGGCSIAPDLKGRIWYGKSGQVGLFQNNSFTNLFAFPERNLRVATARQGGVWVCAGPQIFYCENEACEPKRVGVIPAAEAQPRAVLEDRSGALWIGTSAHGLFRCDGGNVVAVATSHLEIETIAEDRELNLWVGTAGGGLNRLRPRVLEVHGSESGLPSGSVRSVCLDGSGTAWMVMPGGELARYTGSAWQPITIAQGWPNVRATCVVADHDNALWVGTLRNGLRRFTEGKVFGFTRANGLASDTVRSLMVSKSGDLWAGLESGYCLQQFRQGVWKTYAQPPAARTIRTMAEDNQGNVWLGTSDGYLLRVQGDLLVDETGRTLGVRKPIRALQATEDGSLWIGYASAGIGRLRKDGFSIVLTNGLADNYICAIQPDTGGGMWFTADKGIFQVRRRGLEAVLESKDDHLVSIGLGADEGFPNLQGAYGYWPNSCRMADGRILFAMRTGLAVVHPDRMQPNRIPPPVHVERIAVDGQALVPQPQSAVRVRPGSHKIDIDFTALSSIAPEEVKFRHRLAGWDEDWVEAGKQRSVSYSRLRPGRYDFQVTACNIAGIWNPQAATVPLEVQPFLWQTWPFRIGVAVLTLAGLALAVRTYERRRVRIQLASLERQRDIERERARIARDIHDDLGAGLAQIALLADLGAAPQQDLEGGKAQFARIADRARTAIDALEEIVWAANPRNDNLARLADYVCQSADECFEAGETRCRKDVPSPLPEVPVSAEVRHNLALAVKEALTNVFKHSRARTVWLRLRWADPELTIEVEDDGQGFSSAGQFPAGNGLANQAARMKEIQGTVRVHSVAGQGTKVTFQVRLGKLPQLL